MGGRVKTTVLLPGLNNKEVTADAKSVRYDLGSLEVNKPPKGTLRLAEHSGTALRDLSEGERVTIKRAETTVFAGIVEQPRGRRSTTDGLATTIDLIHEGYSKVRQFRTSMYDYDEDGDPATNRDSVTINPWNYPIIREPGSTLDVRGLEDAAEGVRPDELAKALIGESMVVMMDFQDNRWLLPSQSSATTNTIQVYQNNGNPRPALQITETDGALATPAAVESIPIWNGDQNIHRMGDISAVTVTLVGTAGASGNPTLTACRNASQTNREYETVTLTRTDSYNGSGLTAWSGTVTFDAPVYIKNALGLKFNISGATVDAPVRVYAAKVIATIGNMTGVTSGTISTYTAPVSQYGDETFFEGDLSGLNYLEALERVRLQTESTAATNPSPHWDIYIDNDLALQFTQRRGQTRTRTYKFSGDKLRVLDHEFYAGETAFQTIGVGAGSDEAQTIVVSKQAFDDGGLYDWDRDGTTDILRIDTLRKVASRTKVGTDSEASSLYKRVAQSFVAPKDCTLDEFAFVARRTGTPLGSATIRISESIYSGGETTTLSVNAIPSGTDTVMTVGPFAKSLEAGKTYYIAIEYNGGDASNYFEVAKTTVSRYSGGQFFQDSEGAGASDINGIISLKRTAAALYGTNARVMRFTDTTERSPVALLRKTRAAHKKARDPMETIAVEFTALHNKEFDFGDTVSFDDIPTRTLASARIVEYAVEDDASQGERHIVRLGDPFDDLVARLSGDQFRNEESFRRATPGPTSAAFDGQNVYFDATRAGPATITIEDGASVSRVLLHMTTTEWQAHFIESSVFKHRVYDNSDGTGTPIYAQAVQFSIDPTAAGGRPSTAQFTTDQAPMTFGVEANPETIVFDATHYLTTATNGTIASGKHHVWFKGQTSANNSLGLGAVNIRAEIIRSSHT